MTLKQLIESDNAIFFNANELGVTIQYNGVEIIAIPNAISFKDKMNGNTFSNDGTATAETFMIKYSDVSNPGPNDFIQYNNKTWYFARILDYDESTFIAEFTSNESPWG